MEFDIYTLVENDEIECKEALGGLPKDLLLKIQRMK